ncbi:hypothetical protein B9G69_003140 [Bdellovibrio sp. SKB1291214]|uniref:hypothetical protein n=1 Tax=Bdellovibrio sp. SKB1291214 TaxID=1732569 RepID=UPI000B51546E|nr:hypothetical protein [Bdellovibrio sp. SKB1291214]UYL09566.1 hypothetical protein B9G69_003140 [Bdellovibrio sp. SKB1291214]
MKKYLWPTLFAASTIWASVVSVLYWQLRSNPRVIAVTTDMSATEKGRPQSFQVAEMEKVTFLRQYLDRYFTYDSNNFWQSQTSLTFLMSQSLREKRIQEVQRLRDKIQSKSLNQKSLLLSLAQTAENRYHALLSLQISEERGKVNQLYVGVDLAIESTDRTLENPWGFLITQMNFPQTSPDAVTLSSTLGIREKAPLVITFPCAIENIEVNPESVIETKITTLNVSEIQLTAAKKFATAVTMIAFCKDKEYHFSVSSAEKNSDMFRAFTADLAQMRKIPAGQKKGKDIYDKTIENVLGIQIEN